MKYLLSKPQKEVDVFNLLKLECLATIELLSLTRHALSWGFFAFLGGINLRKFGKVRSVRLSLDMLVQIKKVSGERGIAKFLRAAASEHLKKIYDQQEEIIKNPAN